MPPFHSFILINDKLLYPAVDTKEGLKAVSLSFDYIQYVKKKFATKSKVMILNVIDIIRV